MIATVYRAANARYCEQPFGDWGHPLRIDRGDLYVRISLPPGESMFGDPFDAEGWSTWRCCLECAIDLPGDQYKKVLKQTVTKRVAASFGLPERLVADTYQHTIEAGFRLQA